MLMREHRLWRIILSARMVEIEKVHENLIDEEGEGT
jgi:hypothetical protein